MKYKIKGTNNYTKVIKPYFEIRTLLDSYYNPGLRLELLIYQAPPTSDFIATNDFENEM